MRVVKDLLNKDRETTIRGTGIKVVFKNGYAEVDEQYIHHFTANPAIYEVQPVGTTIPTVDVKEEKVDNKDIKTESSVKKS